MDIRPGAEPRGEVCLVRHAHVLFFYQYFYKGWFLWNGMYKRSMLSLIICFIILSLVSVSAVGIVIKTEYPDHGVLVRVRDTTSADIIESLTLRTDAKGETGAQYETGRSKLLLTVMIVKDGTVVQRKDFPNQLTESTITLWMYTPPVVSMVNVTNVSVENVTNSSVPSVNTTNLTTSPEAENKTSPFSSITGKVSDSLTDLSGRDYLMGAGVLLGLVVLYGLYQYRDALLGYLKGAHGTLQEHAGSLRTHFASRPEPALSERSFRTLQTELRTLKQQHLKEARARFDEAKEELRRAEDNL